MFFDLIKLTCFSLICVVGSPGGTLKGKFYDPNHPGKDRGHIIIEAEEVSKSKRNVKYVFIFALRFYHLYYLIHLFYS